MSKPRLTIYISNAIADRLDHACQRPGANKSKIVDAALDRYLQFDRNPSQDNAVLRRLDHMSKQGVKLDRDVQVLLESLALFIRHYLAITPPLPKSEQDSGRALGHQRFEQFVAQVGKRLALGQTTVAEVLETIAAADPDLLIRDAVDPPARRAASPSHTHTGDTGAEAPASHRTTSASPVATPGASKLGSGR